MPYKIDYSLVERGVWIFQIENAKWQKERFDYENKHYGKSYEFGGNVNEMLTDFKHYLFSFHDQFIEIIARGFWFEESRQSLFKKDLMEGHPFLHLPLENSEIMTAYSLKKFYQKKSKIPGTAYTCAKYCSQKVFEFAIDENKGVQNTMLLSYRDGKLISTLRGCFGRQEVRFDGFASLEQCIPFVEKYMKEEKRWGKTNVPNKHNAVNDAKRFHT